MLVFFCYMELEFFIEAHGGRIGFAIPFFKFVSVDYPTSEFVVVLLTTMNQLTAYSFSLGISMYKQYKPEGVVSHKGA